MNTDKTPHWDAVGASKTSQNAPEGLLTLTASKNLPASPTAAPVGPLRVEFEDLRKLISQGEARPKDIQRFVKLAKQIGRVK